MINHLVGWQLECAQDLKRSRPNAHGHAKASAHSYEMASETVRLLGRLFGAIGVALDVHPTDLDEHVDLALRSALFAAAKVGSDALP